MNGFRNKIPGGSLIGRGAVLGKMLSVMEERPDTGSFEEPFRPVF